MSIFYLKIKLKSTDLCLRIKDEFACNCIEHDDLLFYTLQVYYFRLVYLIKYKFKPFDTFLKPKNGTKLCLTTKIVIL